MDGGDGGVGAGAARGDDDNWGDVGAAGRGGLWLPVADAGVVVSGVVVEGGVVITAVEVADPAGRPPFLGAAGHQANFRRSVGADGHAGHRGVRQAAQTAGEEASFLHQALQAQLSQAALHGSFLRVSFCLLQGAV